MAGKSFPLCPCHQLLQFVVPREYMYNHVEIMPCATISVKP
jgi:hypothetical protein